MSWKPLNKIGLKVWDLPKGTRLIPKEKGFYILPPEECMKDKEAFEEWYNKLLDYAIDKGLKEKEKS